uniref:Carboxylic ester hydrolase n=1 Tax=Poecilia latipinna TaxID=48699 RepID=A0A3B3UY86_9TELE
MAAFQPLLLLLLILTASFANENQPIVYTKYGRVRGRVMKVLDGYIRVFLGIPYARPPVGSYRFMPPTPMPKWEHVKDAGALPNSCYQIHDTTFPGFEGAEMWNPNTPVSEDCLYLNVWGPDYKTPTPRPEDRVPVLVWIYGGAFVSGTSTLNVYQGHFLCKSQNVVVVSMNYRLGPLGFLAINGNQHIRGNQGLLDQRLALKWVVDNIAAFGGDPKKITIFGESAGAASVGFHLVSPGSQGLFQRAVMQSGAPNAAWAIATKNEIYERYVCLVLSYLILDILSNSKYLLTLRLQYEKLVPLSLLPYPFVPHIDGDVIPSDIEVSLYIFLFIGLNKDEGTFFLFYSMPGFTLKGESLINRNIFMDGLPLVVNSSKIVTEAAILDYTDWRDEFNTKSNRDELAKMAGDSLFDCPVLNFATRVAGACLQLTFWVRGGVHPGQVASMSQGNTETHNHAHTHLGTFFYFFDHVSSKNPWPKWAGAMHGYEIEFVFGMPLNPVLKYQQDEITLANKTMQHYGDFARTGNPKFKGGDWPLFKANTQEYLSLNDDSTGVKKMLKANECHLWNNLFPKLQNIAFSVFFHIYVDFS